MESIDSLVSRAKQKLLARDFNITNDFDIRDEVERAIHEINRCRNFEPHGDKLYDEKYENLIIPLTLCAFAKIGAEGQTSHGENNINRNYTVGGDYPKDELAKIIPLIK